MKAIVSSNLAELQCKGSTILIYKTLLIRHHSLYKHIRKSLDSIASIVPSALSIAEPYRSWSKISSPGLGKTIVV